MTIDQPKPTYTARPPSLAHKVISFFVANPDEAMTAQDIVSKYDAKEESLNTLLQQARKSGAILHNGGLYMLGCMKTAKACIEPGQDTSPEQPQSPAAESPPATPAPAPAPASPTTQSNPRAHNRGTHASRVNIPGAGDLSITYEPLASRTPVSGHKWDPLLDMLASAPLAEEGLATIRLPRTMAGAVKAGIESWQKRNAKTPFPCRFRASVSGNEVLVQRIG